ncbi:MAG: NADH-quinone oxidoreductase subunit L [Bdellovibrionota bacterium]|jgi:NADH-quinone oxidoreductase subunit L
MNTQRILNESIFLLLWLPLLGAIASFAVGKIKPSLAGWVASVTAVACAALAFALSSDLQKFGGDAFFEQTLFTWLQIGKINLPFVLRFDHLTAVMTAVVTGVGSLIHFYAISYMKDDASRGRFFAYMNLFMFFMLLLVLGGSLPLVFIGWEGVGLCSYLLIGFWFQNDDFAAAGKKAFIVNRIGDAGFLLAMFSLLQYAGTLDFLELQQIDLTKLPLMVIAFALFAAAVGKSAQIPLFVWLPDAMAGPTPVSALIHAATMVTAGVYLLVRTNFIFSAVPTVQGVILGVGVATAFFAATVAMMQNDIKKVLAYSTISQLGFMFVAIAAGAYQVAIFHVVTHSFFKACLFLCAGSIIIACQHDQDMRKMGGLLKKMPLTFLAYLASTFAISGIFPFAGYYSKHAIIEAAGASYGDVILLLLTITSLLTAFYMMRTVVLIFFGKYRGASDPKEAPPLMLLPVLILGALATCGGYLLFKRLPEYLSFVVPDVSEVPAHLDPLAATFNSWTGYVGIALAGILYLYFPKVAGVVTKALQPLSTLVANKYYVDEIYDLLIVKPLKKICNFLRGVDKFFIDGVVEGSARLVMFSGEALSFLQCGNLRFYALLLFCGVVAALSFVLGWIF